MMPFIPLPAPLLTLTEEQLAAHLQPAPGQLVIPEGNLDQMNAALEAINLELAAHVQAQIQLQIQMQMHIQTQLQTLQPPVAAPNTDEMQQGDLMDGPEVDADIISASEILANLAIEANHPGNGIPSFDLGPPALPIGMVQPWTMPTVVLPYSF